ncbi:MAG: S1 RNA-binding domain-containing protein [Clostridia bacterium]|nr:S1 RNA-binding domain-containing protein [Clostridia bacterium]
MQIEEGAIVNGKVTGLTDFGAFVELENGKTGMIHISEVAPTYVKDIREHLSVGQAVQAKVLSVSPEGKISLSIKKLNAEQGQPAPRPAPRPRPQRRAAPQVWNGPKSTAPAAGEKQSFEDMMARFKQVSDEKITDLKRSGDSKRGSPGYSRRSSKN